MSDIISAVTTWVNAGVQYVGSFVNVIMETPLLLAGVTIGFVGLGIGLITRLLRTR